MVSLFKVTKKKSIRGAFFCQDFKKSLLALQIILMHYFFDSGKFGEKCLILRPGTFK
jgi:hypothetical protein